MSLATLAVCDVPHDTEVDLTPSTMVTVVLPAFNEEMDLPPLLERIGQILRSSDLSFRILVVDDGSVDDTVLLATRAARNWPIEIISHKRNLGLGAAVRTGLNEAAKGRGIIVVMDADNSHDPAVILRMIEKIESGSDVVIASRFHEGGKVIGVRLHRRILSSVASSLFRCVVRYPNIRDYSCGFRAYRVEIVRSMQQRFGSNFIRENGFACMFELLLKLRSLRANVSEVPLVLRYDQKLGASKIPIIRTVTRYLIICAYSFFSFLLDAIVPARNVELEVRVE